MSTTLGQISSSGVPTLNRFKCQPGQWITEIAGVTNPNGAMGVSIVCSDGKKSPQFGASAGSAFSFDEPKGLYVTGGNSYASSIGPSSNVTFGPSGSKIWSNKTCLDGERLAGMNIYYTGTKIVYLENPTCIKPAVYVPPTPPSPTVQSCAPTQVVSGVTTVKDSTGKVVGVRYRCSDWTYQPMLGTLTVPAGGSSKLETSTGYGDLTKLALGANVDPAAAKCPAGQAYNTITTTSDLKIIPSKCIIVPPPYEPPVTSSSQDFKCTPGNYFTGVATKNATTGLGMQFMCDGGSKTGVWYGPKTGIAASLPTAAKGFTQVDYTTDPKLGVTSLTILGTTQGSKVGSAKTFKCPSGQIVTGVLGKWTPDRTDSLAFYCTEPPYKVASIPINIAPVPPIEAPPVAPPPAAPTDQSTAAASPPPTPPAQDDTVVLPPMPPIPDYTVMVPAIDTSSSMNTYLMIMLFVVVIAAGIFLAIRFRSRPTAKIHK